MNPINVTGYDRATWTCPDCFTVNSGRRYDCGRCMQIKPPKGGRRKMKIHYVTAVEIDDGRLPHVFLVKAHTRAGAESFVRKRMQPVVTARVATQDDLVNALNAGIAIEDATDSPQASIPEPAQTQE